MSEPFRVIFAVISVILTLLNSIYVRTEKGLSPQKREAFLVLIRWVSDVYWVFVMVGFLTWLLFY